MECPVCQEGFNPTKRRPKFLHDCGHTICGSCLVGVISVLTDDYWLCPICRMPSNAESSEEFRDNFIIFDIADRGSTKIWCRDCDQDLGNYCSNHNVCTYKKIQTEELTKAELQLARERHLCEEVTEALCDFKQSVEDVLAPIESRAMELQDAFHNDAYLLSESSSVADIRSVKQRSASRVGKLGDERLAWDLAVRAQFGRCSVFWDGHRPDAVDPSAEARELQQSDLQAHLETEGEPAAALERSNMDSVDWEPAPERSNMDSLDGEPALERPNMDSMDGEPAPERSNMDSLDAEPALERSNIHSMDGEPALERSNVDSSDGEPAPERSNMDSLDWEPAPERSNMDSMDGEPALERSNMDWSEEPALERPNTDSLEEPALERSNTNPLDEPALAWSNENPLDDPALQGSNIDALREPAPERTNMELWLEAFRMRLTVERDPPNDTLETGTQEISSPEAAALESPERDLRSGSATSRELPWDRTETNSSSGEAASQRSDVDALERPNLFGLEEPALGSTGVQSNQSWELDADAVLESSDTEW